MDVDLAKESAELQGQLRVIKRSGPIAAHPLSVHARVPRKDRAKIAEAVLTIAKDPGSGDLLRAVRLTEPLLVDYEKDYRSLEEIDDDSMVNGVKAQ